MGDVGHLVLGVDPGSTRSALSLVRLDEDGWLHIDYGAHLDNETETWRAVVLDAVRRGAIIAVEILVGYAFDAKRVQALIETARFEGRVLEMVGHSPRLHTLGARDWRGELCRSPVASDEQVRVVIEGITLTRPKLLAASRPHVYDAAGVAIAALARELGRPFVLPRAVETALHLQQQADKAARAAKRAEPQPPRILTRAQRKRRSAAATRVHRAGGTA